MYDPISIAVYGRERQREIDQDLEAYWKARLIREERGQPEPASRSLRAQFQWVAHLLTALYR